MGNQHEQCLRPLLRNQRSVMKCQSVGKMNPCAQRLQRSRWILPQTSVIQFSTAGRAQYEQADHYHDVFCDLPADILSICISDQPAPRSGVGRWSVKEFSTLNSEPRAAVWKFINHLWGNNTLSPEDGKLCSFHFADLRRSGELSLVVSYDDGGTADCNDVAIFARTRAQSVEPEAK